MTGSNEHCALEHPLPFMLSPNTTEAVLLLLVISAVLTTVLHTASLTHIVGILILVLMAKIINITYSPRVVGILANTACARAVTVACPQIAQARLQNLAEGMLAWTSGVAPEEKVMEREGFTEAGKQFQYRAGIIGAVATFVLIYKIVGGLYSKAYSAAKASARIAELDIKPKQGISTRENQPLPDTADSTDFDEASEIPTRSNPLLGPDVETTEYEATSKSNGNPLKIPRDSYKSCCTACKALENARANWIKAVKQYEELNDTLLKQIGSLKEDSKKLHNVICILREEVKVQDDRIAYLDVLLEEAGKQLGHEADVKDMLWEAYCKRRDLDTVVGSSEAEMTPSPPPYDESGA